MSKHTPGRWHLGKDRHRDPLIMDAENIGIAVPVTWPEWKANARLIAAAPDLLERHTNILKIIKGVEIGTLTYETAIGMIKITSETGIESATGQSIDEITAATGREGVK